MKAGSWDRSAYVGTSLAGKTIAVYGFGKVRVCMCVLSNETEARPMTRRCFFVCVCVVECVLLLTRPH